MAGAATTPISIAIRAAIKGALWGRRPARAHDAADGQRWRVRQGVPGGAAGQRAVRAGEKPAVDFFSRGDYESPEEREARLEKQLVAHLIKVSEERETRLEQQLVVFLS